MNPQARDRLFGYDAAFDHPVTLAIVVAVVVLLVAAPLLVRQLSRMGRLSDTTRQELNARIRSWVVLAACMMLPILLGAAWTIAAVFALSILCYREYARVTGLFRERMVSLTVVVGIVLVTFAVADHWYGFFVALGPLGVIVLAAVGLIGDQPKGYIQRVALGVFGYLLFGVGLGHAGYMANDAGYRPILALLLLGVCLNDVFAYLSGKLLGRRKLSPHISPNKTVAGAVGALLLTTLLVAGVGALVFRGQPMAHPAALLLLGLIISFAGQVGDLVMSAIKRDIGIKDTGALLPGHGGVLDRFDSLLLVAPAVFHLVHYVQGVGLDQPTRLLTLGRLWS
jgi:phosphatidate cytidylyltransferase